MKPRYRGTLACLWTLLISVVSFSQTAPASLPNCSRLMPLGDSTTVGANGGYRKDLYDRLVAQNCGVSLVGTQYDQYTQSPEHFHEGHPYFTIGDIARDVDGWLAATQPNTVLLMIGTNDIASWTQDSADKIGGRLDALVGQIQRALPNVWIFVASIPPMSSAPVPPNNVDRSVLTTEYNSVVHASAESRAAKGQRVRFVDVNAALSVDDLADGIHPKESAQPRVAAKFVEAIIAAMRPGSVSMPSTPSPTLAPTTSLPSPTPAASPAVPPPAAAAAPPARPAHSSGGAIDEILSLSLFALLMERRRRRNSMKSRGT